MADDARQINEQAYDNIAAWYLEWANSGASPRQRYAEKVLQNAPSNPRILELGCGPGVPITKMLLDRGASVVANDISTKQVSMATERCPEATFIAGDMTKLEFEPESFDGVTCFYALFHLPREDQKPMLAKIFSWLKPGGMLVFNSATVDEEEIHGEMMGHGMFWSSFDVEGNKAMVTTAGFELVEAEVVEAGDGKLEQSDPDYGVKFLWIAARKGTVA
ncbi:Putative S-adenosyl-L-methionine-dependent methyltransferase, Methyltransferase domain 25 [Septoria linicola]|uniref:S-adenosyl-L-methionine-dependent methyltransferase, Methyltransferase domain 25 n=1 Tax=Septoria linicola TaxID=215465 RepID=A0A9Q9B0Q1_9PEZI|nr:putative S-adenosyl-L-methionine-dependent methyltransferase, Methyltransferase domain 25 [Septoria linicola]USW55176.1 Putative S-adenosyl-L-methionine-dependent methyltransferase, Methyltransferase domain 25 [Septoria linicola]